jgi:aryl-alcohol dehydrogenase-like predicted oxidoreductase
MIAERGLGDGVRVSAIGLGAMGLSGVYGPADDRESETLIHHALDRGIDFIDSASFYGAGHNEMLIGRAVRGRRDEVTISLKVGVLRGPDGVFDGFDGRPGMVRNDVAQGLSKLGVSYIDIVSPSRIDHSIAIEETVGALADLVKKGFVKHVGLSEASPKDLRRANAVHPVAAVQIEYSLWTRDIEAELIPTARELGVGIVAYSPLGRGFLSGTFRSSEDFGLADFRRYTPRYQGENFTHNLELVDRLAAVAARIGCTTAQLALAWVLSRGDDIVPIVGTRRIDRLDENLAALNITLDAATLAEIEAIFPPGAARGTRYPNEAMATVYQR